MGLLALESLLPAFALVLARVSGIVLSAPMISSPQVPRMIKVLLVAALSLAAFPVVAPLLPGQMSLALALTGLAGEFLIGELLGLGAGLLLFAAEMAGKVVSHQAGFALGQVFNPLFDEEFTVLDQLWFLSAFVFFLALGGHLAIVAVLLGSFRHVPPLAPWAEGDFRGFVVGMLSTLFDLALRLSGPVVLALLLASLVMGFLTRTMPQMNIISVGFGAKIAVALLLTGLTLSGSGDLMAGALADGLAGVDRLLESLSRSSTHGA